MSRPARERALAIAWPCGANGAGKRRARPLACGLAGPRPMLKPASLSPMTPVSRDLLEPIVRDVAARGARIRFVEAGSGAPLLLVHDYLASRVSWEDVVPTLS